MDVRDRPQIGPVPLERLLARAAELHVEREVLLAREQASRAEAEAASRAKDEFLAMLSHELRNPVATLALQLDLAPAWVSADTARTMQVVTNLLTNAIKYPPEGGTIRVTVRADDDHAVLRVSDTGLGIAPELLPRIFDLFAQGEQSLDRTRGGLGIGLTLVRRLVEQHGGHVEAHSDGPGKGSEFVVRLPRSERPVATERPRPPLEPLPARSQRILIVEDNADAREALGMFLRMNGHLVHEAKDGWEALALALRNRLDVALIDIGLPGFDGYELARRLKIEEGPAADRVDRLWAVRGPAADGRGGLRGPSRQAGRPRASPGPDPPAAALDLSARFPR